MFKQALDRAVKLLLFVGVLLGLLAVVEVLRAYVFLRQLSPAAAIVFAVAVGALLLGFFVYAGVRMASVPRVLTPPPRLDPATATAHELYRYGHYLVRYLRRLALNPRVGEAERARAQAAAAALRAELRQRPPREALAARLPAMEREAVRPALATLSAEAEREVRRSTRDVMLGVALSPYHSVDLAVVLYRNVTMILRLSRLYAARPRGREQWLILRDVLRVVATVNFFNLGKKLLENLFSNVPFIGRGIDDIGQGLGAGLLTSAAGHAAMQRCEAFLGWDRDEAARSLAGQTRDFLADVRDLFLKDVLPDFKIRLRAELPPETTGQPGFWDRVNKGIDAAVDATTGVVDDFVVRPVAWAGESVARGGRSLWSRLRYWGRDRPIGG